MNFVIIGIGQFGRALALNLTDLGFEVTALDIRETNITPIKDIVANPVIGDATDIRVLRQLNLTDKNTCVIVTVGEQYERNILITAQLKELGVQKMFVRSVNDLQARVLKLIGINDVFRVEEVAAKQLCSRLVNDGMVSVRKIDSTHSLAEVKLPAAWVGKKLAEVGLRQEYRLNLLTVRRGMPVEQSGSDDVLAEPESPVIDTPDGNLEFLACDILVLFGKDSDLKNFVEKYNL